MRILIVEDEPAMLEGLLDVLTIQGYTVVAATRGREGLARMRNGGWQLAILDAMLPELSGFEILKAVREAGDRTPVIMLTARNTEVDKLMGFQLGVDDYVTKPFSIMELLCRIQAVLRRCAPEPASTSLTLGEAMVDFNAYAIVRRGHAMALPAKAIAILKVLHARAGEVVTRDTLIDEIWGIDEYVHQRTVNNMIGKLRAAIEADAEHPRHIKTIHGVGYRLDL